MTKKDFELIARVVKAHGNIAIVRAFAEALAVTNPAFDKARFMEAAGGVDRRAKRLPKRLMGE